MSLPKVRTAAQDFTMRERRDRAALDGRIQAEARLAAEIKAQTGCSRDEALRVAARVIAKAGGAA